MLRNTVYRLDAYKTDEENWEQYTPKTSETEEKDKPTEPEKKKEEEKEKKDEEDKDTTDKDKEPLYPFKLHQGKILETYKYTGLLSMKYDSDYEGMSNEAGAELDYTHAHLKELYKGIRCSLYNQWNDEEEIKEPVSIGFIIEEKFTDNQCNLSITGMSRLLEDKYQFNFTQMHRSKIIEEVIKTAGLKPMVDATGLDDDIIDYTNVSKSGDSDSGGDASSVGIAESVQAQAKAICKGISSKEGKIKAIYDWESSHIHYRRYNNSQYGWNSENVLKAISSGTGINCCDTAVLSVALCRSVGVKANFMTNRKHCIAKAYYDGGFYYMDRTSSRRGLNEVWSGGGPISSYTEGENPYGNHAT